MYGPLRGLPLEVRGRNRAGTGSASVFVFYHRGKEEIIRHECKRISII